MGPDLLRIDRFGLVVASLSLHYFPWSETLRILEDVRRCAELGGYLLARFNSTRDPHYSTAEKQELENNFYLVGGMPKRLFDRQDLDALFEGNWQILHAEERTTRGYGGEKPIREIAARKADERGPKAQSPLTSLRSRRAESGGEPGAC